MNIVKCDLCGKVMTWDEWSKEDTTCVSVRIHKEDGNLAHNEDLDFCEECTIKFLTWLKGAKKGETDEQIH